MLVFLGGTCNNDNWRDIFLKKVEMTTDKITYFNPIVSVWDDEAKRKEESVKKACDIELYAITKNQSGFFTIAELVNSAHLKPRMTILCVIGDMNLRDDIQAIINMVKDLGVTVFTSIDDLSNYFNNLYKDICDADVSYNEDMHIFKSDWR